MPDANPFDPASMAPPSTGPGIKIINFDSEVQPSVLQVHLRGVEFQAGIHLHVRGLYRKLLVPDFSSGSLSTILTK